MKKTLRTLFAFAAGLLASAGQAVAQALESHMVSNGLILFATTKSDALTGLKPRRNTPVSHEPLALAVPFTIPAVFAANDILALAEVPAGVEIVDYTLAIGDADSGGAPALALSLGSLNAGLTDIATTYQAGITAGQTGGTVRAPANSAPHFTEANAAVRTVGLKVTTAAQTLVPGTKGLLTLQLAG